MSYVKRFWAPVVGAVAIVVGFAIGQSMPASFGWFAYAPLTEATFVPAFVMPLQLVGWGLTVSGLVLIAGWVGFLLGRRRVQE